MADTYRVILKEIYCNHYYRPPVNPFPDCEVCSMIGNADGVYSRYSDAGSPYFDLVEHQAKKLWDGLPTRFVNSMRIKLYVGMNGSSSGYDEVYLGEAIIMPQQCANGIHIFALNPGSYELTYSVEKVPSVKTLNATDITATGATLNGQLTSLGATTTCPVYFAYGKTNALGNNSSSQTLASCQNFKATITGLAPSTTYHFIAVANPTTYGEDFTFKTSGGIARSPTLVRQFVRPSITQPSPQVRQMSRAASNIPSTSRTQSAPINRSASLRPNAQAPRPGYTTSPRIVTRSSPGGTSSKTQPAPIPRTRTSPTRNIPSTSRIQPAPVVKPAPPQTTVQTPVQSIKKPLVRKK